MVAIKRFSFFLFHKYAINYWYVEDHHQSNQKIMILKTKHDRFYLFSGFFFKITQLLSTLCRPSVCLYVSL